MEYNNFRQSPGIRPGGVSGNPKAITMKKQIRLNAFAMNCVAHQSPGLWTHPRDRTLDYNRLPCEARSRQDAGALSTATACFSADVLRVLACSAGPTRHYATPRRPPRMSR